MQFLRILLDQAPFFPLYFIYIYIFPKTLPSIFIIFCTFLRYYFHIHTFTYVQLLFLIDLMRWWSVKRSGFGALNHMVSRYTTGRSISKTPEIMNPIFFSIHFMPFIYMSIFPNAFSSKKVTSKIKHPNASVYFTSVVEYKVNYIGRGSKRRLAIFKIQNANSPGYITNSNVRPLSSNKTYHAI